MIRKLRHGMFVSCDGATINTINELIDENEKLDSELYDLRLNVFHMSDLLVTLTSRVKVLEGLPDSKVETVKCPCGYREECSIHCGLGHDNGQCTPWPKTYE